MRNNNTHFTIYIKSLYLGINFLINLCSLNLQLEITKLIDSNYYLVCIILNKDYMHLNIVQIHLLNNQRLANLGHIILFLNQAKSYLDTIYMLIHQLRFHLCCIFIYMSLARYIHSSAPSKVYTSLSINQLHNSKGILCSHLSMKEYNSQSRKTSHKHSSLILLWYLQDKTCIYYPKGPNNY